MDKQQKLLAIIDLLKASPAVSVTITNTANGQELCKHMTAAEMDAQYGSVEDYFNALVSKGVYTMVVITRRRNGSSWINHPHMGVQHIEVEKPQPVQEQNVPAQEVPAVPQQHLMQMPGLGMPNMGALMGGLNALEMVHRHQDYNRVVADNTELKSDNKRLKEENDRLKYEALENRFSDKKAEGNKEMLNGFAAMIPQLLPMLLAGRNGAVPPGAAEGLAGAGITPEKQEAMQVIMEFPDNYLNAVHALLVGFADNSEFQNEAFELMKKHNLIT